MATHITCAIFMALLWTGLGCIDTFRALSALWCVTNAETLLITITAGPTTSISNAIYTAACLSCQVMVWNSSTLTFCLIMSLSFPIV